MQSPESTPVAGGQPELSEPSRPQGEPVVETRGLSKRFRDFWFRSHVLAVDELDLRIERHEVFGLLGPNGSGKSTTIKILLGLLDPSDGDVRVLGRPPRDVVAKRRIGYLPEESYLYPHLTAEETIDFFAQLFGLSRTERRERTDRLLESLGLGDARRRPVGEFSKGMQRRVGLAQALINEPELLILDEPTTGLDPIGTRQVKDLIRELKDAGTTVILSSHQLADVEDVCDRVAILYGGRVRAAGVTSDLLRDEQGVVVDADALRPETIRAIEAAVREREGASVRVQPRRQTLESFFLDVVKEAEATGVATSGATTGSALGAGDGNGGSGSSGDSDSTGGSDS